MKKVSKSSRLNQEILFLAKVDDVKLKRNSGEVWVIGASYWQRFHKSSRKYKSINPSIVKKYMG